MSYHDRVQTIGVVRDVTWTAQHYYTLGARHLWDMPTLYKNVWVSVYLMSEHCQKEHKCKIPVIGVLKKFLSVFFHRVTNSIVPPNALPPNPTTPGTALKCIALLSAVVGTTLKCDTSSHDSSTAVKCFS